MILRAVFSAIYPDGVSYFMRALTNGGEGGTDELDGGEHRNKEGENGRKLDYVL